VHAPDVIESFDATLHDTKEGVRRGNMFCLYQFWSEASGACDAFLGTIKMGSDEEWVKPLEG
jgi:hypothetical protein